MATKTELADQVHGSLMLHADTLTRAELLTLVSDLTFNLVAPTWARQQAEEKLATGLWEIGGVITVVQP